MSPEQFDQLLEIVKDDLQKTASKNPLSPSERLTMTLHYLSEGCSMQQIAWDFYVGKTTVHCVIKETCKVLWDKLQPLYLEPPSVQDFENISKGFYERWNMPNCLGALDGKHVMIQCPAFSGSEFFSYKKSFRKPIIANLDTCQDIVKATVVLHNFLQRKEKLLPESQRRYCPTGLVDREECSGIVIPGIWRENCSATALKAIGRIGMNNYSKNAKLNKEILAKYFDSLLGGVPWQERQYV
ncbi:hypothetical protein JTB14_018440 [Gonioctena quinquepunctata]|nr:hypothetical protein JTB14_018440 [Gonioctena quinquepunctata]